MVQYNAPTAKTFYTLPSVCVACGDLHESGTCPANKLDQNKKKCGNCGGNHTANYRGWPVYKDLKSRMIKRIASARSTYNTHKFIVSVQSFPDIFFSNAKMSSLPPVSTIPDVRP